MNNLLELVDEAVRINMRLDYIKNNLDEAVIKWLKRVENIQYPSFNTSLEITSFNSSSLEVKLSGSCMGEGWDEFYSIPYTYFDNPNETIKKTLEERETKRLNDEAAKKALKDKNELAEYERLRKKFLS